MLIRFSWSHKKIKFQLRKYSLFERIYSLFERIHSFYNQMYSLCSVTARQSMFIAALLRRCWIFNPVYVKDHLFVILFRMRNEHSFGLWATRAVGVWAWASSRVSNISTMRESTPDPAVMHTRYLQGCASSSLWVFLLKACWYVFPRLQTRSMCGCGGPPCNFRQNLTNVPVMSSLVRIGNFLV